MSAVLAMPPVVNPLPILQRSYALLKLGGKVQLVELPQRGAAWADSGSVAAYSKPDGVMLLERALQTIPSAANARTVIQGFYASTTTHVFDDIAFDPRPTPATVINLWRGPTVLAASGPFPTLQQFLSDVIAGGDAAVYDYLLDYLAHMLQKPEDKPGVMPVLMGGQGTGKGTFFRLLATIWAKTAISVNQIDQITGKFNNVLERFFVVFLDEALFRGNRDATDKLKSLITEPQITIEAKHQTPRAIFSCHRFFAATNAEHFAHIDRDDRRMLYLPIPATYQNDSAYWKAVNDALSSPEVAALVDHLEQRDITLFDPRQRPKSAALTEQKLKSLVGVAAWWHEVLQTGATDRDLLLTASHQWIEPRFVSSRSLVDAYKAFADRAFLRERTVGESDLKKALARLCPSATYTRKQVVGAQSRGYDFPDIAQARTDFEQLMGGTVDWGL